MIGMIKLILAALLVATSGAVNSSCASAGSFSVGGRNAEGSIRERLLAQTPIGTNVSDVAAFINTRLKHEGGSFPTKGNWVSGNLLPSSRPQKNSFEDSRIPDLSARFSEKWLNSETLDIRIVVSIHQGLPFRVWTTATWQFGRDGSLKEIVIKKHADGL